MDVGSDAHRTIILIVNLMLPEATTGHWDCCSLSLSPAQCRDRMALSDGIYDIVLPYLQASVTQVV